MSADETIHRCPANDGGLTPCCGKTPFELPRTDRITEDAALVTCRPVTPRCLDCGSSFRYGEGYGDAQLFCSETCADAYRRELGA